MNLIIRPIQNNESDLERVNRAQKEHFFRNEEGQNLNSSK